MGNNPDLLQLSTELFSQFLKKNNIHRFYFAYEDETQKVKASHPLLDSIADFLSRDKRDFDKHEGAFFEVDKNTDTILGAFVHKTNRGQAAGGVRYWNYPDVESYLRDGLRLAQGMTRKNALAGLWWGGGKGVMAQDPKVEKNEETERARIYSRYGEFMTSLNGCYVTAEDAGTSVSDMDNIFSRTRFTTCIPFAKGGSGNPSVPTARGVMCGIEAALDFSVLGPLEGKKIAVQGAGHVGIPLIKLLFEKGVGQVVVADIDKENLENAKKEFTGKNLETRLVNENDNAILFEACDVLVPCAAGAILNQQTIPRIQAKIICGAANNQLEDADRDDDLLFDQGTIYVPDFLTNRMGIVNCANEQYGYVSNDPAIDRHFDRQWEHSIYKTTIDVLKESVKSGLAPARVAIKMADVLAEENHPIFGHRGVQIINTLKESGWSK